MALGPIPGFGKDLTPERRLAFAKPLLDAGARLDIRDGLLKSTPLGWACRWGRVDGVKLLLERGADPVEADAEPWAKAFRVGRKNEAPGCFSGASRVQGNWTKWRQAEKVNRSPKVA
jgi:hypothetical protein